ncbi:aminoglycoside 6'-N-acetyltransferase [Chryseomicrobium sp. FSL W7-1435]|uniref:aminoglycoside 6'-N-acetyltransferase n=1 Tax=Chryseomicrobium sp. FSL W7-1435 TaxID=2921704 RepID=UPI003159B8EC
MKICELTESKALDILPLLEALWPGQTEEQWKSEIEDSFKNDDATFFIAYSEDDKAIGFSQVQLRRDYVEGTETSPVGYLEGLYVKESERNKGIARDLVQVAENWARDRECKEFASDVELANTNSQLMHERLGFQEVNRVVCYVKPLGGN